MKKRVIPWVLLWLGAAAAAGGQTPAAEPSLPEFPAVSLDKSPALVRAAVLEALAKARASPRDAGVNGELAMTLHAHNFLPEAEVCYRRARLLDPGSFRWAYYLGYIQVAQANCSDGLPSLRGALRLKPDYLPAQLMLGKCLLVTGGWGEAHTLYETVIRTHPENADAHYGLGRALVAGNQLEPAIKSFRRAFELFPDFGAAHFAAARAYHRLGKGEEAEAEMALYKKNKGLYPETEDPLIDEIIAFYRDYGDFLELAHQLGKQGKLEEAAAAYEGALRIQPQLTDAHVWLIQLYGRLGQAAKVEEHYRAALGLDPGRSEAYFWYGVFAMGQGKKREAEQAFRKVLEINPHYSEARTNLGYLLEGDGRLPEAMTELRISLEQSPDSPPAHFSLGRILVKQENFEEGIPHLLKALSVKDEETRISYLHAIGVAYAGLGDLDNALRYLHLSRKGAAARNNAKLVQSIAEDLRLLEAAPDH